MNIPKTAAPTAKPKTRWLLLVAYVPLCCIVIGWLAYVMKLKALPSGGYAFKDVFWSYAVPRPGTPSIFHIPALAIGLFVLVLLISLSYSPKPVMTLFQVRIILLVLIAVLTLLAKIWSAVGPLAATDGESGYFKLSLFLLFTDIDIVVVFLMTFLPPFRRLKTRLV